MSNNRDKLLLVSLVVNGLLAGFLVGDLYHGQKQSHFPPGPPRMMLDDRAQSLPPELRARIDGAMEKSFANKKDLHEATMKRREEAVAILKKEKFDEVAFRKKMDELFGLMGQMGGHVTNAIVGLAQDVTPQERAQIAEILIRRPGPPEERRGDGAGRGAIPFKEHNGPKPDSEESAPDHP